MIDPRARYLTLHQEMLRARDAEDEEVEDRLLEELDLQWWRMSQVDRRYVREVVRSVMEARAQATFRPFVGVVLTRIVNAALTSTSLESTTVVTLPGLTLKDRVHTASRVLN
jgi:hypothetical protein